MILKRFKSIYKNFLVLISSAIVFLCFVEVSLEKLNYPKPIQFGWGNWEKPRLISGKRHQISNTGLDLKILLIGDSQAENKINGVMLSDLMGMFILEKRISLKPSNILKIKSIQIDTLASMGWGQDQQLLALRNLINKPNYFLSILWFTPENDVWNNTFPTNWPTNGTPKPTFIKSSDNKDIIHVHRSEILPKFFELRIPLLFLHTIRSNKYEYWMKSKNILLKYYSMSRLVDPDGYWDNKYLPKTGNYFSKSSLAGASNLDNYLLNKINPFTIRDNYKLEKCHFCISANENSQRIKWGAKLTNLLIKAIRDETASANSYFFSFWYDTSKTKQPNFPSSGYYKIKGSPIHIHSALLSKRMDAIMNGVKSYKIYLETQYWRKYKTDPHLSFVGNVEIADKLSDYILKNLLTKINNRKIADGKLRKIQIS